MALSLRDITVRFNSSVALDGVSFDVARGEVVGLLGPNGSGKSTALSVAAGLLEPASGRVLVNGFELRTNAAAFAASLGYVPQDDALYDELTAAQNLEFFAQLQGLQGGRLDAAVARGLARAKLTDRADERVASFSGGMKRRLSIAAALAHDPVLLLLDEPSASLDAAGRDALLADLQQLKDDGHAILMTTHLADDVSNGCDRTVTLDRGRLVTLARTSRTTPARSLLYAHLHEPLPKFQQRTLKPRLAAEGVELEVVGRRLRLAASGPDELGRALALLLAEGIAFESFNAPPARSVRAAA